MMIGTELQTVTEAEQPIGLAEIAKSAAIPDTLISFQEAEAVRTAIVATCPAEATN